MPCSRKFSIFAGIAVLACSGLGASAAEKKDKDKDKDKAKPAASAPGKPDKKGDAKKDGKKATPAPTSEDGEKLPPKLVIPLPKGQDSKGVIIPYTDATGKKTMVFKIGIGTRVDDNHIKMGELMIETYDEKGAQEMTIALPTSVLDMESRVISGNETVQIDRADFRITGKKMEFNTESRQGWIKGDVKMIIYNLSEEAETGTEKSPEADSENQKPKGS